MAVVDYDEWQEQQRKARIGGGSGVLAMFVWVPAALIGIMTQSAFAAMVLLFLGLALASVFASMSI